MACRRSGRSSAAGASEGVHTAHKPVAGSSLQHPQAAPAYKPAPARSSAKSNSPALQLTTMESFSLPRQLAHHSSLARRFFEEDFPDAGAMPLHEMPADAARGLAVLQERGVLSWPPKPTLSTCLTEAALMAQRFSAEQGGSRLYRETRAAADFLQSTLVREQGGGSASGRGAGGEQSSSDAAAAGE